MKINVLKQTYVLLVCLLTLASCGSKRNLVYFSDISDSTAFRAAIQNDVQPRIQPDDILSITVSSLNPESNVLFNKGTLLPVTSNSSIGTMSTAVQEGYLVDKNGEVNFPVLGKIKLTGLTKEQARARMEGELSKYVKDPIVNIRFLNFKVTVIGEVMRPSSFTIPNEKINVLEALGMAGDMTPFGKRENVLVMRERDGVRDIARINLNSKDVLSSPYFYLQQNDVVYVEPVKAKAFQASNTTRFIPILVSITSIATLIISRLL